MDYPFAALVGQDMLKTALLLNAVHAGIGGVLIRGEKGTAKSTAARALAGLLPELSLVAGCPFHCDAGAVWTDCPHCSEVEERRTQSLPAPFVELPLGATEDRVLGTLDFERALQERQRAFQPGLLAGAHRGVLYIDEVNLLADHLVDVLLDVAASGINTVEREGMSLSHPAQFVLIGTMNPEEGELRPQLLDRFGLMVEVRGPRDPEVRAEVVRRRLAYDRDPEAFCCQWQTEQDALRQRIGAAREGLGDVVMDGGLLTLITRLCCEVEVDGLRADIALYKTACALAALEGQSAVGHDHIRQAAALVLPHRLRRKPFEQPGLDPQRLEDTLERLATSPPLPSERKDDKKGSSPPPEGGGREQEEERFDAGQAWRAGRVELTGTDPLASTGRGRRNAGARQVQGQYIRAVPDPQARDVAIDATLRAAALRQVGSAGGWTIEPGDLHRKERAGQCGTLILFLVDSSGSMAARRRMELVKVAVLGLLEDAYEQRDEVGVVAYRGVRAEVLLAPTGSVELAERALQQLPTGGRTPLAHALLLTRELVQQARRGQPELPVLVVLLSDGKANVGLPEAAGEPWAQAEEAAKLLAGEGIAALVFDSESGFVRTGRATELAAHLKAEYLPLEKVGSEALLMQIRQGRIAKQGRRHG